MRRFRKRAAEQCTKGNLDNKDEKIKAAFALADRFMVSLHAQEFVALPQYGNCILDQIGYGRTKVRIEFNTLALQPREFTIFVLPKEQRSLTKAPNGYLLKLKESL